MVIVRKFEVYVVDLNGKFKNSEECKYELFGLPDVLMQSFLMGKYEINWDEKSELNKAVADKDRIENELSRATKCAICGYPLINGKCSNPYSQPCEIVTMEEINAKKSLISDLNEDILLRAFIESTKGEFTGHYDWEQRKAYIMDCFSKSLPFYELRKDQFEKWCEPHNERLFKMEKELADLKGKMYKNLNVRDDNIKKLEQKLSHCFPFPLGKIEQLEIKCNELRKAHDELVKFCDTLSPDTPRPKFTTDWNTAEHMQETLKEMDKAIKSHPNYQPVSFPDEKFEWTANKLDIYLDDKLINARKIVYNSYMKPTNQIGPYKPQFKIEQKIEITTEDKPIILSQEDIREKINQAEEQPGFDSGYFIFKNWLEKKLEEAKNNESQG